MICTKWEQASKMRQWINERKGKKSVIFEKSAKDEFLKKLKSNIVESDQIDSKAIKEEIKDDSTEVSKKKEEVN
jgi:hypothetical protein